MTKLTYRCKCGEELTLESSASQPIAPELVAWRKLHEDCDKNSKEPSRFVHLHDDVYLQLYNRSSAGEVMVRAVRENAIHYGYGILVGFQKTNGAIHLYRGVDVPGISVTPRNNYLRMEAGWQDVMKDQALAEASS